MSVKLLAEHHLEFISFKGGCRGSYESTLVKMSNCWKSHAVAQFLLMYRVSDNAINKYQILMGLSTIKHVII